MRRTGRRAGPVAVTAMSGLLLVACGGVTADDACGGRPSERPPQRTVEVPHRGPAQVPGEVTDDPVPRLVVQLTNSQPDAERLRLAFDGRRALDVDLPRYAACGNGPAVFSVGYDLEPGPVDVELDTQGEATTTTIEVPETGTIWAVIQVQDERDWAEVETFDSRPSWG